MSDLPAVAAPAPVATVSRPSGPRAGFWTRFAAALIDSLMLGVVEGVLIGALGTGGLAIGLLVSLGYFSYFEGSPSGQTIGKRACNIRVIDFAGGSSIGHRRAAVRWLGRIISGLVFLLGYLWMLWDKEKQCWQDKLASSVVVPTDAYPVTNWPG
jgi:uncharacterized RDD family membrane protein YckC